MTSLVPTPTLLTLALIAAPSISALWLIRYLHRLLDQLPRCNADMVLTEHPIGPGDTAPTGEAHSAGGAQGRAATAHPAGSVSPARPC